LLRAGHAETELSGEFFAVRGRCRARFTAFRDADVIIDERTGETLAPRSRLASALPVVVVLVDVGFLVLHGAAIALEMQHRR
jgi:hypothetical protein